MSLTFKDLQDEVKRRGTRDQAGTNFDTAVKNVINTSLKRVAREATWRSLRRKSTITTVEEYDEGTGAAAITNGSTELTVTGATFITDGVKIGRRIKLGNSYYTIDTITGETTLTIDRAYAGTTLTAGSYTILPQEEYNLPIQSSHRIFLWHEEYGYPYLMHYTPDMSFYATGTHVTDQDIPTHYRMWGEDMVIEQLKEASVISMTSSSASDTAVDVTVFGVVSGYPDQETITVNGTNSVSTTKSFTSVERIVKDNSTTGRLTLTANSGNTTVAVLPTGDTTAGIKYSKVQLYPLPSSVFNINVYYYKEPYSLFNDEDVHELGADFDEAIILLSVAKIKAETEMTSGMTSHFQMYKDEIRSLRKTNMDKIDWIPQKLRPNQGRPGSALLHRNLSYGQVGSQYGPSRRY